MHQSLDKLIELNDWFLHLRWFESRQGVFSISSSPVKTYGENKLERIECALYARKLFLVEPKIFILFHGIYMAGVKFICHIFGPVRQVYGIRHDDTCRGIWTVYQ